jgi:hypothetical protein
LLLLLLLLLLILQDYYHWPPQNGHKNSPILPLTSSPFPNSLSLSSESWIHQNVEDKKRKYQNREVERELVWVLWVNPHQQEEELEEICFERRIFGIKWYVGTIFFTLNFIVNYSSVFSISPNSSSVSEGRGFGARIRVQHYSVWVKNSPFVQPVVKVLGEWSSTVPTPLERFRNEYTKRFQIAEDEKRRNPCS